MQVRRFVDFLKKVYGVVGDNVGEPTYIRIAYMLIGILVVFAVILVYCLFINTLQDVLYSVTGNTTFSVIAGTLISLICYLYLYIKIPEWIQNRLKKEELEKNAD